MGGSPLVLIVEDSPDHAILIQAAFRAHGARFGLRVMEDGAGAIDYLSGAPPFQDRDQHPLPAAIILDIRLPQVEGFEILEWLRDRPSFRRIPVLVFTASANPDDAERAYALGARAYRRKPADFPVLVRAIEDLLAEEEARERGNGTVGR